MKLSSLGEFGLIDSIRKKTFQKKASVPVGIGDDAAVLNVSPNAFLLATTDMLLEGVHFDLATTDYDSLGWKSAAVNLSDIAAMGGIPRFCLTALAVPSSVPAGRIMEFYRGFDRLLRAEGAVLAGGDTCLSRNGLVITVTVLGEAEQGKFVTRSGARCGDRILVTGPLGDAGAGLELIQGGSRRKGRAGGIRGLVKKHLLPVPRVKIGRMIALSGCVNAMIDISDGLASDLHHICEKSRVGAVLITEKIPLSPELVNCTGLLRHPPLQYALSGGEDYELLFTVPPEKIKKLRSLRIPFVEIGEITSGKKIFLEGADGSLRQLPRTGYDHFRTDHGRRGRRAGSGIR